MPAASESVHAPAPSRSDIWARLLEESSSLRVSQTATFAATVKGTTDPRVTWQVNGVSGGNKTAGTISPAGVYTAPAVVPSPSTVTVRAVSVADPTKSGVASVVVLK